MIKKILILGLCIIVSGCLGQGQDNAGQQDAGANPQNSMGDAARGPQRNAGDYPDVARRGGMPPGNQSGRMFPGNRTFDGMNPPPEAVEACTGKSAGDECEFLINERSIVSTCVKANQSGVLTCMPEFNFNRTRGEIL